MNGLPDGFPQAPYASVDDQALSEEDQRIRAYYAGLPAQEPAQSIQPKVAEYYGPAGPQPPTPPAAPAVPPPYQPNPGLPGYNPNPGAATTVAPQQPSVGGILGATPPASKPLSADAQEFKLGAKLSEAPLHAAPPIAPTEKENADLAAFIKSQQKKPAAGGGGGGGKANPDPYGILGAQRRMVGSYDTEADAIRHAAEAEGDKATMIGMHRAEMSRRMQEDAAIEHAEQEHATQLFTSQLTELSGQLDEVRSRKIQPIKTSEAAGELGWLGIIGAALGGFQQGLQHLKSNPYMDHINTVIDRQMAADERNLANEKDSIQAKMNLLGQQRAVFKDDMLAKAATRNLYYESLKEEIAAEASQYDVASYRANAEKAIAEITRQQAALQKQIGDQARAQAMSAASQQYARTKEVRDFRNQVYDKVLTATGNPAIAEQEANRQTALTFAPGMVSTERPGGTASKDPISAVPKGLQNEAYKELKEYTDAQKAKASLDQAFAQFGNTSTVFGNRDTWKAAVRTAIKPHIKGANSDKDLEALIDPFVPSTGESDANRAAKLQAAKQLLDSGVTTPTLDTHSPGWRPTSSAESRAALGATPHK